MTFARRLRDAFIATLSLTCLHGAFVSAHAQEPYKAQIDALRKAMEKYKDYKVAVRDLYLSTVGCVHYSGEKIPGSMEYAKGAMGVHFGRAANGGDRLWADLRHELKLVAVKWLEWLVPLTADTKEVPSLFGQRFMGPMEGHEPLIPKEFHHYDLHAWLLRITRSACSHRPTRR